MIVTYIIILWIVFWVMTASSLYSAQYHDHQVLGVVLSKAHSQHDEIEKTLVSFTKACRLVLLLSAVCSLLLFVEPVSSHADFIMILLMMANLFVNWLVIDRYQMKLQHIKEQNNWIYPQKNIVTVDLEVARDSGKSAISPVWVWLFLLLDFLPTVILLFHTNMRQIYPIGFSLIGPLCQLSFVYLFYQMRGRHSNTVNAQFARQEERINSIAATLSALAMLVFWLLFSASMMYAQNGLAILAPVIVLLAAVFGIIRWQQSKISGLEEKFADELPEEQENAGDQQILWKWGFYYDPGDPRLFVPKRMAGMGWTINIGRPAGKLICFGITAFLVIIIGITAYGGSKDYQVSVSGPKVTVDAAMYDMTFDKSEVQSVTIRDDLPPDGTRVNGYGGQSKSYGHFSFKGYGSCMLYIYNNVDRYVVVQLKGNDPGYVILNGKTQAETDALYHNISSWSSK